MKWIIALSGLALVSCQIGAADSLEKYMWKNRVIIHNGLSSADSEAISTQHKELQDRDLLLIRADNALKTRFGFEGKKAAYVLIGKDGREKDRQSRNLELTKFFKLIDQMPMRKREIRERRIR